MKLFSYTPLIPCFLISVLVITGCAAGGGGDSPSGVPIVDEAPTSPGPGVTPVQDPENSSVPVPTGGDRADAVNKELADTVNTVKGQNGILPKRGVFFSVGIRNLELTPEAGDERTGSESDITNLSIGYDQIITDSWVVGTLVDVSRTDEMSVDQDSFSISSDALSVFLFSSLEVKESVDLSAYAGYSRAGASSTRFAERGTFSVVDQNGGPAQQIEILSGQVQGDSDSDVYLAGLSVARRTNFGVGNLFVSRAEVDFIRNTTYAFTEQGTTNSELFYAEDTKNNIKLTLSGGISRYISRSAGVFIPTLSLAVVFDDPDESSITAIPVLRPSETIVIDSAQFDRNYGIIDFDLLWVRPSGLQLFGNINTNFENDFENAIGAAVGARLEF